MPRGKRSAYWTYDPRPRPEPPPAPPPPKPHPRLRSPVSPDLIVNVIFEGEGKITKGAIDATIAYLRLWREAVEYDEANENTV